MKRSQFESMVRKVVKEELPQLNKGSQPPASKAKVKDPQLEKVRYIAQSIKTLLIELDELEKSKDGESYATQSVESIKKLIKAAQVKFLKEYVSLYK